MPLDMLLTAALLLLAWAVVRLTHCLSQIRLHLERGGRAVFVPDEDEEKP